MLCFIHGDLLNEYCDIYALFPVEKYRYKCETEHTLDIEENNSS